MAQITLTPEQADSLYDLAKECGFDSMRQNYSGRGMNGKTCVGFICSNPSNFLYRFGVAMGGMSEMAKRFPNGEFSEENSLDPDDFSFICTDKIGKDAIVYFPHIKLPEE